MSLWRWIRKNGIRRGIRLWRINRRFRTEMQLAHYARKLRPEFRMHHGEKPRMQTWRERRS